jgi:hypothetical protein
MEPPKGKERSFAALRMTKRCVAGRVEQRYEPRRVDLGDGLGDGFFPAALGF